MAHLYDITTPPRDGMRSMRDTEEIIWHVVSHEQYHRGQVFTRLALLRRVDLPDRDLPDHDLLR